MKKTKLGIFAIAIALFSACDSHEDDCHECHIAYMATNGTEIEVEITNSEGGEEFCGSELEEAEDPDFTYTLDEDVIIGNDTIPAGVYSDIHCEEHAH